MKKLTIDPINSILTRGVQEVIVSKELENKLRAGKKLRVYLGIDPTGTRLHLGHAIALRKLQALQDLGHHVIFLIGSFTALIGDTSDKDSERQPLDQSQIDENFKTYKSQAEKVLDFSKVEVVYNGDWLGKLGLKELIELANKFTVQQMIEREMYQRRLSTGKPIGLHEFLYPLMQGYDSVALDVDLEIGGNDQLFNMLAGRTLLKAIKNKEKHVMTVQLLEGTDGRKMSKTNNNVINITAPANEQYGQIMSMKDELISQYFTLCTDLSLSEIADINNQIKAGENPRDFKMRLGREIVKMYHGEIEANEAEQEFIKIFQKHDKPTEIEEFSLKEEKLNICDLLSLTKLASSKSDARRLVDGGGVKIDDIKVENIKDEIVISSTPRLLQVGKRKFLKIKRV